MREITKIGVKSVFKLGFILYGVLGLLFSLFLVIFGAGFAGSLPFGSQFGQLGLGLLGVVIGTLFYALMGGVVWAVLALIYNILAQKVGGVKVFLS